MPVYLQLHNGMKIQELPFSRVLLVCLLFPCDEKWDVDKLVSVNGKTRRIEGKSFSKIIDFFKIKKGIFTWLCLLNPESFLFQL